MLDAVWDFETHTVQSEAESILLEGKLIKEYRPRYNVSFRDDKRFLLVKVDQSEEWPRFRLARFKKDDNARYFGPYAHDHPFRLDDAVQNFLVPIFGMLFENNHKRVDHLLNRLMELRFGRVLRLHLGHQLCNVISH